MKRKITSIIVGLFLLIMAAVPAAANAALPDRSEKDLSSLPAIEAYLASIGVGMESVVVQQGPLNYAGPLCPGDGWNCTAANAVVQISTATSGANIFDCLPAVNATFPALNECLIVQSSVLSIADPAPTNYATCGPDMTDSGKSKSKCTFRQTSKKGNNYAEARARTTQRGGGPADTTQSATQDANITQMSTTGSNTAKITETIEQTLNTGRPDDPTQTQNAHQTATVYQQSDSGNNWSYVQQTQFQVENAASDMAITQDQNTDSTSGRNQVATVTQITADPGTNTSSLGHLITQRQSADCPACPVKQSQGSGLGGQSGKVTQTDGTVTQTTDATQNEDQLQDADTTGTWMRSQLGPQDCCGDQFGGTKFNHNIVKQVSKEVNGGLPGSTISDQSGMCTENVMFAQCEVHESIIQNGTPHQNDCPSPMNPSEGSCTISQFCTGPTCGEALAPLDALVAMLHTSLLDGFTARGLALQNPSLVVVRSGGVT